MTDEPAPTAEEFFAQDARALGYMPDDPHPPGDGRGLTAYYRDFGALSPRSLARIAQREMTNWRLPGEDS